MKPRSKIVAPSFKFADIYGPHRMLLVLGVLLCFVGLVSAGVGGNMYQSKAVLMEALDATQGTLLLADGHWDAIEAGDDSLVPELLKGSRNTTGALAKAGTPILFGDAKAAFGAFSLNWSQFSGALGQVENSGRQADVLHVGLAAEESNLLSLGKRLDAIKVVTSGPMVIAATDSLARLQSYSESIAGGRSAARIEYDTKNLVYAASQLATQASGIETRALLMDAQAFQARILPLATAARTAPATQEALHKIATAGRTLATQIPTAVGSATNLESQGFLAVTIGALITIVGGICAFSGLFLAMREFGNRFQKAIGQFRKNETSLSAMIQTIELLKNGDLTTQAPQSEDANLKEMGFLLNDLAANLRVTFINMQDMSQSLQKRFTETEGVVFDIASRASSQERGLNETNQRLVSVFDTAQTIAVDAQASSFAARQAMEAVQNGSRAVMDAVENMDGIRETIQETSKRIKRLGERSQEIGEVTEILSAFSEKINILALNAALEAERAGEQGRGFAVVAQEVRRLSGQAEEALEKISSLVTSMQGDTREAIDAMERSTNRVVGGAHVTELAGVSLEVIRTVMDTLAGMVNAISATTTEQNERAGQVNDSVAEVLAVSSSLSDDVSQAHRNLKDMQSVAGEMDSILVGYQS